MKPLNTFDIDLVSVHNKIGISTNEMSLNETLFQYIDFKYVNFVPFRL